MDIVSDGFKVDGAGRVGGFGYQKCGSDTTELVALEGYSVNMTPEQTEWVLYLSPATYYQFFILDNTSLGILDTSRLGW